MTPVLGIIASSNQQGRVTAVGSYDALATAIVPSGGLGSITFAGVPTGYRHLQIRIFARTNRASTRDGIKLRLNGDSGTNYAQHNLLGDGANASSTGYASEPEMALDSVSAATSSSANMFGSIIVDILDYSNTTKNTTVRSSGGNDGNGDGKINLSSNLWNNTSAVTNLYLAPYSGTLFSQYSSFALYGVK